MRPSPPRRATLAAAALLMLAACIDEPTRITTPDRPAEQVDAQPTSDGPTSEFPTVRRLDVKLTTNGAFRPGVPIHFSASATANLRAEDVRYELLLLDGGEVRPRPLASWRGSLNRGASRRLEGTVTFRSDGPPRGGRTAAYRTRRASTGPTGGARRRCGGSGSTTSTTRWSFRTSPRPQPGLQLSARGHVRAGLTATPSVG